MSIQAKSNLKATSKSRLDAGTIESGLQRMVGSSPSAAIAGAKPGIGSRPGGEGPGLGQKVPSDWGRDWRIGRHSAAPALCRGGIKADVESPSGEGTVQRERRKREEIRSPSNRGSRRRCHHALPTLAELTRWRTAT